MTHTPTTSGPPHHTPTTCYCCGRHATGIGLEGFGRKADQDPHFICTACSLLIEQIKATRHWDTYEHRAIEAAVDGVGPLVERFGADLSGWTAEQAQEFAAAIILGFGDEIRRQVREQEVPF